MADSNDAMDLDTTLIDDIENDPDSGFNTDENLSASTSAASSTEDLTKNLDVADAAEDPDAKELDAQLDYAMQDNVELVIETDNNEIPLNMDKSATVGEALNRAAVQDNFESNNYDLSLGGKVLPRTSTLRTTAISRGTRLRLVERPFQIFIRRVDGRNMTMDVRSSDTIESLKQRFNYTDQVPVHQQRLLFQSQELENTRTIQFYKIRSGSTLEMVYRLRGGA